MLRKNIAPEIKTNIDINSDEFIHNKDVMLKKINFLNELLDKAELGGGAYHHERLAKRGKMPVRKESLIYLILTHLSSRLLHLLPMEQTLLWVADVWLELELLLVLNV